MENTINYKEENENLRLRIELSKQKENVSKQRENEMKMEKELILLRRQYETPNVKSIEVGVDEPMIDDNVTKLVKLAKVKDKADKANSKVGNSRRVYLATELFSSAAS